MTKDIRANCPECGYEIDDATGVGDAEGERPDVGGLAVCIRCAGLGYYEDAEDGTLRLRALSIEEKVELSDDEEVMELRERIWALATPWHVE